MNSPDPVLPRDNPTVVEVTRGPMVESRHRAAFAVSDTEGRLVLHGGDANRPVFARSAIKPLQALALVESGAAEAFDLGDAEIALACASHNGETRHVETVTAWLERIGCSVDDLECGAHLPYHEASAMALLRGGGEPTQAHNNCSGKHSGFLSVARHLGSPLTACHRGVHRQVNGGDCADQKGHDDEAAGLHVVLLSFAYGQ